MRTSLLLYFIVATQLCNGQTFKIGTLTSFHRDIVRYANLSKPETNRGDNVIQRYKAGIRAAYSPWYRVSIEPGLAVSTSKFSDALNIQGGFVRAKAKYQVSADEYLALQSHKMTTLSPSVGILFKTNKTKGCVTFITLNFSRNYTIRESEKFFSYKETAEVISSTVDTYSNSESKFEYQGAEIDFSFGAYWHIENFDGEIRLEPKINLYRKREDNKINTAPDVLLYNADLKGYTNMGFEVSINKNIRKRKTIGRNRGDVW